MPSYSNVLSVTEMWQVSQLLANADKPLPPAAVDRLKAPLSFDVALHSDVTVTPVGKPADAAK